MDKETMLLLACVIILLVVIVVLVVRGRRTLREKDRGIVRSIREQMRLSKELEQTRIEKETMEKIVSARRCEDDAPSSAEEQADDICRETE